MCSKCVVFAVIGYRSKVERDRCNIDAIDSCRSIRTEFQKIVGSSSLRSWIRRNFSKELSGRLGIVNVRNVSRSRRRFVTNTLLNGDQRTERRGRGRAGLVDGNEQRRARVRSANARPRDPPNRSLRSGSKTRNSSKYAFLVRFGDDGYSRSRFLARKPLDVAVSLRGETRESSIKEKEIDRFAEANSEVNGP
ncbi:uncharacterized protein LOC143151861 [Ptiloglossa arizonensis]|uniref:uncharacterized protein LOC143151861 n=1 Tax=Ptiloglossa arizonensis TaxID=3350558 RepID=UPI003F9FDC14